MNDKPKGRTLSKQKLEIVHLDMDVPYSQGTKLLDRVQAKNWSLPETDPLYDKALRHTIFKDELKTFIRGKENIVADVEERDRPESEYGPDRTIVQVYDDQGQPVSRPQAKGGGAYRRPVEDDMKLEAFKRVSIEGQASIIQVGAFLVASISAPEPNAVTLEDMNITAEDLKRIVGKYWQAVEKGLDNYLKESLADILKEFPAVGVPRPDTKPGNARQKPQDGQGAAEKPAKVSSAAGPPPPPEFKNIGELLTAAGKLKPPVTRAEILGACQVKEPAQITDLKGAWQKAQVISGAKKDSTQARQEAKSETEKAWDEMGHK
jgi:hypothetical protein